MSTTRTATASSSSTSCRATCGKTTSRVRSTTWKTCRPRARKRWRTGPTARHSAKRRSRRPNRSGFFQYRRARSPFSKGSAAASAASGRLVAGGCGFVLVEVELDLGAMRVVKEKLPEAAPDARRQAAQLIGDVGLFQLLGGAGQVGRGERHMVDHAGAYLVELFAVDHV